MKDNITTVRDQIEKEYKGCDLRFAFVRYTDYDVSADTRTTWIDFTTYVSYDNVCITWSTCICLDVDMCI